MLVVPLSLPRLSAMKRQARPRGWLHAKQVGVAGAPVIVINIIDIKVGDAVLGHLVVRAWPLHESIQSMSSTLTRKQTNSSCELAARLRGVHAARKSNVSPNLVIAGHLALTVL